MCVGVHYVRVWVSGRVGACMGGWVGVWWGGRV